MELLVLANSKKLDGKCLAGVTMDDTLTWVRPIDPEAPHGEVDSLRCRVSEAGRRRAISLLDVVDVPVGSPCPLPHQPENVELGEDDIRLLRVADRSLVLPWLRSRARTEGGLLGLAEHRGISVGRASEGLNQSLDLVLVENPEFHRSPERRWQVRSRFQIDGVAYDLSVTDPVLRSRAPGTTWEPGGEWLFVISITEPFQGTHWLLVAGCIELDS